MLVTLHAMKSSPQHIAAFRLLDEAGILKGNYAPPIARLLWKMGFSIPPPHFMTFVGSAVLSGTTFGTLWGLVMLAFAAATGTVNGAVLLGASAGAGVLFGITMATYYAYGRKRYKLPKWSSLRQIAQ